MVLKESVPAVFSDLNAKSLGGAVGVQGSQWQLTSRLAHDAGARCRGS